jgi:hypothetical protein
MILILCFKINGLTEKFDENVLINHFPMNDLPNSVYYILTEGMTEECREQE